MKVRPFLLIARGVFDRRDDPPESLHEKGPRAGNVDALESIPFGSEEASLIEKDTGLIQEELSKLLFVQTEGSAVEPDKIGALGVNDPDFRELTLKQAD